MNRYARALFLTLWVGPSHQGVRLTDGPHGRRLQPRAREGGELTGVAVVDGEAIRGHRRAQGGVAVRVEVEAGAGAQGFADDEEDGGKASGGVCPGRLQLQTRRGREGK